MRTVQKYLSSNLSGRLFWVCAALIIAWALFGRSGRRGAEEATTVTTASAEELTASSTPPSPARPEAGSDDVPPRLEDTPPESNRVVELLDTRPALLSGQVSDTDGEGLEGARVSWTAWNPEFLRYVTSAVSIPHEVLEAHSVQVRTTLGGSFEFKETPPLQEGQPSFLWFTYPAHLARVIELKAGAEFSEASRDVVLESAEPCLVRVLRDREPVENARVWLQAAFPGDARAQFDEGEFAPKAQLVFHRSYLTSADGSCSVARHDRDLQISAGHEGLRSRTWRGPYASTVELRLHEAFSVIGVVSLPEELDPNWGRGRVQILRVRASLQEEIRSLELNDDGSFGPSPIPLLEADHYVARLAGNCFLPDEQDLGLPRVGDEVFVNLTAEKGHVKWFQALDHAGNAIPHPEVQAEWMENGVLRTKRIKGRDDGYVMALGLPTGFFSGRISAEGYSPIPLSEIYVPEDPLSVLFATLSRGFQLRGRCVRGIEPVPDFELRYWPNRSIEFRNSKQISGSESGEFLLDDLPAQQVSIMAIAPGFGRSDVITVDLEQSPDEVITLQIAEPNSVAGTVVDARTGRPIAGATVTAYSNHLSMEMDPIGPPEPSDSSGRFLLPRLGKGINLIAIQAPGYSQRELKVIVRDETLVDLGSVELSSFQPLTARLKLRDGGDPTQWVLTANGIGAPPTTAFDSQGEIYIEEASEGAWQFEVRDLAGTAEILASQFAWLKSGEEWHLEFDLVSGRGLLIQVEGYDPSAGEALNAWIEYPTVGAGRQSAMIRLDDAGEARVEAGVGVGEVLVQTLADYSRGSMSGSALYTIDESDDQQVVIPIALEETETRLRVVDTSGKPLPGVRVQLRSERHAGISLGHGVTDGLGELVLGKLPDEVDRIDLTAPDGGLHQDIVVALPHRREDTLEVVFDQSATIRLRIVDDGIPQSNVTCRLWDEDSSRILTSGQTPDDQGSLVFRGLCPGTYRVKVESQGHWPTQALVNAGNDESAQTIQVSALAGIELRITNSDGTAYAKGQVDLEHIPTGQLASTWIAKGLLPGFDDQLVTDSSGVLELPRLPHGKFRWSANGSTGQLEVNAGELLRRTLVVQ